jgi:hypothetical protein
VFDIPGSDLQKPVIIYRRVVMDMNVTCVKIIIDEPYGPP